VLWFPGPNSESGEDVAELQLHGGHAVIAAVLSELGQMEGLRPAEPGEFTRRAFANGKLDLTAVEGLADLIAAETDAQRRQAFRQMKGMLSNRAEAWRSSLIGALAQVDAPIDFPDEGDVPETLLAPALRVIRTLADEIFAVLQRAHAGERLREGLVVAIAGPPNAGKSSLFNCLAGRDAAIVSPYAGTTRDVIEVHLDLGGYPLTILDTAGVRGTSDPVEMEGVQRALDRAATADLVLWVVDAGLAGQPPGLWRSDVFPDTGQHLKNTPVLVVLNKIDTISTNNENEFNYEQLFNNEIKFISSSNYGISLDDNSFDGNLSQIDSREGISSEGVSCETVIAVSCTTTAGIPKLKDALIKFATSFFAFDNSVLITRERHRFALQRALDALNRALDPALAGQDDLIAEEIRLAADSLGRLTGRIDVEDVLDRIFSDFCIGK
jgi:tRNA modification GTPase